MVRITSTVIVAGAFLSIYTAALRADPPRWDNKNAQDLLAVQHAMERAQLLLRLPNGAQDAVDALEEQLARIDGNPAYLALLREAYRGHIRNLWLAKQDQLARKYLERLCVLEPSAAGDPILSGRIRAGSLSDGPPIRAGSVSDGPPIRAGSVSDGPPIRAGSVSDGPRPEVSPKGPSLTLPARTEAVIVRPKLLDRLEQPMLDDPFALNERVGYDGKSLARSLLESGEAEFGSRRYTEARLCYEKAYQADARIIESCHDHWAQCIIAYVKEQLAAGETRSPAALEELRKCARRATTMAPSLAETGKRLMDEIDRRDGSGRDVAAHTTIRHLGRNPQGWQVAETAHFRILYQKQSREFVERVAGQAERTRLEMYRKWFGHDGVAWQYKCDLYLHAGADDYCRLTGMPYDSPGHASFEIARDGMKVLSRRMDIRCDQEDMLETTLPRETTSVVLAGMFGPFQLPRWADVGMAVLTETPERVNQHRRNLQRFSKDGSLQSVRELMSLTDFPPAPSQQRMAAFYAQSVSLVEFLAMQRGATTFTEFLRDALRDGYESALRDRYGWTLAELETRWNAACGLALARSTTGER